MRDEGPGEDSVSKGTLFVIRLSTLKTDNVKKRVDKPSLLLLLLLFSFYFINSGAPAREARVGQSPILMEYGQPLFAWLSRD